MRVEIKILSSALYVILNKEFHLSIPSSCISMPYAKSKINAKKKARKLLISTGRSPIALTVDHLPENQVHSEPSTVDEEICVEIPSEIPSTWPYGADCVHSLTDFSTSQTHSPFLPEEKTPNDNMDKSDNSMNESDFLSDDCSSDSSFGSLELLDKLRNWATDDKVSHSTLSKLLRLLKPYHPYVPLD